MRGYPEGSTKIPAPSATASSALAQPAAAAAAAAAIRPGLPNLAGCHLHGVGPPPHPPTPHPPSHPATHHDGAATCTRCCHHHIAQQTSHGSGQHRQQHLGSSGGATQHKRAHTASASPHRILWAPLWDVVAWRRISRHGRAWAYRPGLTWQQPCQGSRNGSPAAASHAQAWRNAVGLSAGRALQPWCHRPAAAGPCLLHMPQSAVLVRPHSSGGHKAHCQWM
jgi:hypothetical protein